ncbi:MAG: sulfotransferase domain-containing protein [bacterium]|nr:sulfotransferase domain-containing protein [bacterium]
MSNTIVWLASYPKSGNTWMRAFLLNYLLDPPEPHDINHMGSLFTASTRWAFDMMAGFASAHLPSAAVDELRPTIYRHYAAIDETLKFLKVHDAFRHTAAGDPMFPPEATRGVVYILRNPLDVAVSFAYHQDASFEDTVWQMNDPDAELGHIPDGIGGQFTQPLTTWSGHVTGWVDQTALPVHVVRYEDMTADPAAAFTAVLRFVGMEVDSARLEKAVRFSSFRELRQQEEKKAFVERPSTGNFFRKGVVGSGKSELSPELIAQIHADHAAVMARFGYG